MARDKIGAGCTDWGWLGMVRVDNNEVTRFLNSGCCSCNSLCNRLDKCYICDYSNGGLNVRGFDLGVCNWDCLGNDLGRSVSWCLNSDYFLCRSLLGSGSCGLLWSCFFFLCNWGSIDFLWGNWGFRLGGGCGLFLFGDRGRICLFCRSFCWQYNWGCHWNSSLSNHWSRSLGCWSWWSLWCWFGFGCGDDILGCLGCWSLLTSKFGFLKFLFRCWCHSCGHCRRLDRICSCLS